MIELECENCSRESHFLGIVCWWGVWVVVGVAALLALAFILT